MSITVERELAGRRYQISTGELAKQAAGAVVIQYGETVVLVAAQNGPSRPGIDFFPLTVDYRERTAAAGRFPGGYIKREGRPSIREILVSRLTDRPIRPLFPENYNEEVQIVSSVLAYDYENDPDVLSIVGASAALCLAPVPFHGPIAAVRVGLVDGNFCLMPTQQELDRSALDLVVAGTHHDILMIEGFAQQLPEATVADAIVFARQGLSILCEMQHELREKTGRTPLAWPEPPPNPFDELLRANIVEALREAKVSAVKRERRQAVQELREQLLAQYFPDGAETTPEGWTRAQFLSAFSQLEYRVVRDMILAGKRLDGRTPQDLRPVSCRVGVLPRVHGSALFTRGETQSLATVTLGTVRDMQRVETLDEEYTKRFMLDYNFPPFSVGEVRPIRGPGRREIGHGALAERSVQPVVPSEEKFPYTIRVISDILESNGSSSMATVCSATLSLMDAGVPIAQPVAGVSIGLVKEGSQYVLLTDIMGDEDHFGDMDFKVAGTPRGVTGIQLDLKIPGIDEEIIRKTLEQARQARVELLKIMLTAIRRPRPEISPTAPRLLRTKIDPAKIGLLIGPGGKNIRAIQEITKAIIDIEDNGTVMIACPNAEGAQEALARIEALAEEVKVGRIYHGIVSSIRDFGAFVEIAPGKDGLCHISELAEDYVKRVEDVCKVGDRIPVKVIAIDDQNRVKLSRKQALAELKQKEQETSDASA
ncbi:MAG: polyribonucleotide nucleotidyltransferase [Planctomycetaceae bacterium]|nr:MAG: polyribonucleotide nucleotidyltransferase [Planctomycetaceae bacterium]